jgi:hypothetical protein
MSGNTEGREERPLTRVPEGLKDEMEEARERLGPIADTLFAAGYRAGLNEAREVVEGLIEDRKAWVQDADADVESHFGETGRIRILGQKAFQKNCEIAGLDEARAALVSLGKEGDGR